MNVHQIVQDYDLTSKYVNTSFTMSEHQYIAMKLTYQAEDLAKQYVENDLDDAYIVDQIQKMYQSRLDNKDIDLLRNVPQFTNEMVEREVELANGAKVMIKEENGFHANAIVKGDPNIPGTEIVISFAGTDFSVGSDVQQTFTRSGKRIVNYSELAKQYVEEIRKKYPNAKIVVNGHSMGGKLAIQIGLEFEDVIVYAFNPTGIDGTYMDKIKKDQHYDNINVLLYQQDIAGFQRWWQYLIHGKSTKNLPFNIYRIDSKQIYPFTNWLHIPGHLTGPIDAHSQGGFRSLDGSLIDIFNLQEINFAKGSSGTELIVFDRNRYKRYAELLEGDFSGYVKMAIDLLSSMEDEIHLTVSKKVEAARNEIYSVPVDRELLSMYYDPREEKYESLKKGYYKDYKYRVYDSGRLKELINKLELLKKDMEELASLIHETAEIFNEKDHVISLKFIQ